MPEFLVSYMDQDSLIRSCHVADAKDEHEANEQGQLQIKAALRQQLPMEYVDTIRLTMLNWERGEVTAKGWVRDRQARQKST